MSTTIDEHDVEWVVRSKDPAIKLVRSLEKKNFSLIVLPRTCYLTGDVVQWETDLHDPTIHRVRLNDCLRSIQD